MAVSALQSIRNNAANAAPAAAGGQPAERVQTQSWINVGVEVNGVLIPLSLGIPVDTMKPRTINGLTSNSSDEAVLAQQQIAASNQLTARIQALSLELEPGEERFLDLKVQIRRVVERTEIEESSNPFSVGDIKLF